ncbi:hypothetical protein AX16_007570 [Volvariella volvacea WC 439]|nr:hypothetical protein AX16_007570 [Volvariella volvacea WC 439]
MADQSLKHMSSISALTPARERQSRLSQHLRTTDYRLGSRSPNSIPSSPTSVHSSSSAIFERDIEPIVSPSPPHNHAHPRDPHRIPRAKTTEQLEHNVPSVLDSAASILAGIQDGTDPSEVAVLAPATTATSLFERTSGFASPIGSFRSRSPSPLGSRSPGVLLSIPQPNSQQLPPLPSITTAPLNSGVVKPAVQTDTATTTTTEATPSIMTPTSAYFTSHSTPESSPQLSRDQPLPSSQSPQRSLSASPPPITTPSAQPQSSSPLAHAHAHPHPTTSHPPSPHHIPTKRLSFMSYSDLLTSTPASTLPLTSLTISASSVEPPPHIPTVSGFTFSQAQAQHHAHLHSASASVRGLNLSPGPASPTSIISAGAPAPAAGHAQSPSHGPAGKRDSVILLDDVGGEWEREGLGRGLEERLEALMPIGAKS